MRAAVVAALVVSAATAHAGTVRELYTHFTGDKPEDVKELVGWRMPDGFGVTNVLLGRTERGPAHVVVLVCDAKQCNGRAIPLPDGQDVRSLGVVDLAGKPGPLSTRPPVYGARDDWQSVEAGKLGWPALVVTAREAHQETETSRMTRGPVTGSARHGELLVLSLAAKDLTDPVVFRGTLEDTGATGVGTTTSYRLEPGKDGILAIVATLRGELDNRSKCLPPKPVEFRLDMKDRKYVDPDPRGHSVRGC